MKIAIELRDGRWRVSITTNSPLDGKPFTIEGLGIYQERDEAMKAIEYWFRDHERSRGFSWDNAAFIENNHNNGRN